MSLKIIYQDDQLIVLDKEPGITVSEAGTVKQTTLAEIIQSIFGITLERSGIIHRLDKNTSGILVVAKTKQALDTLRQQFKERSVKKEYTALVHSIVKQSGEIDAPIGRNPRNRENFIVTTDGRPALTKYTPVKYFQMSEEIMKKIFENLTKIQHRKLSKINYNFFTLLKAEPKTGRTHQIRVHLKYLGFPIVGDEKYAGRKIARYDSRWCSRQFLHASRIEFMHPTSRKSMVFESHLPDDLIRVLSFLTEIREDVS